MLQPRQMQNDERHSMEVCAMSVEAEYYTPEELATKCAVPLERVKNAAYRRKIPGQVKIFGEWRFRKDLVDLALLKGRL